MTKVIATTHNANESAYLAQCNTLGHNVFVSFCLRKFDINSLTACFGLRNHIGKIEIRVGSRHKISVMVID